VPVCGVLFATSALSRSDSRLPRDRHGCTGCQLLWYQTSTRNLEQRYAVAVAESLHLRTRYNHDFWFCSWLSSLSLHYGRLSVDRLYNFATTILVCPDQLIVCDGFDVGRSVSYSVFEGFNSITRVSSLLYITVSK
jgi:hypothetical protein